MKKILKIAVVFLFAFIIMSCTKIVEANSISSISMDIFVDNNGDATITEVWKCYANEGTEVYHPYYNLGNSKITDLVVSEGTQNYETISKWETSGTLSSKAKKCGINTITDGVELCWGISSYGNHNYTATYKITNFVSDLIDSQMIYWTLIPYDFSSTIGDVYIKVHTDFSIDDSVGVWGYGNYGGTAYVYDGNIEMQSDGNLEPNEYMTMLVQFPSGTFNATNKLNKTFNEYLEMADEGTTKYVETSDDFPDVFSIICSIGFIIFGCMIVMIVSLAAESEKFNFGTAGKNVTKDIEYFRDIPCNKDLYKSYYIAYQYGILKNKTDILGAIILKWLKDSLIKIDSKEVGAIFKKEDAVIILNETNPDAILDENEKQLFDMLLIASKDGILESKEFENWCSKSYSKILSWFDKIIDGEKLKLTEEGLITIEEKVSFKIFKHSQYTATPELYQNALQLAGLKKYLKDYTLIKERTPMEVQLFEEYLIYAQMMGIAKEVAKQFKDLYPEIIEQSRYNSFDNIIFINMCATHGINNANSAKARAENYSAGGGGFSAGGGGGGSFGGGIGGRRFPLEL